MTAISREDFIGKTGLRRQEFDIYGLGSVCMRELSVAERMTLGERQSESGWSDEDMAMAMIALSVCDAGGEGIFDSGTLDHGIDVLKGKAQRTVEDLQKAFLAVCGIDDKAIEEAVGNSIEIPSADSSSDSPGISDTRQDVRSLAS